MLRQQDEGFTLLELLVAAGLTALLSLVIARTVTTAEISLKRSTEQAVSSTQAVRFAELLKYDVAGTQELYVFGSTPPTDMSNLCSTWSSGNPGAWTDPSSPGFVRPLVTLEIPTVIPPTTPVASMEYLAPVKQRVGYELRREGTAYSLYRVVCDGQMLAQRLLTLGTELPATTSGQSVMQCFTADGSRVVPAADVPTMSQSIPAEARCTSFGFIVPYSGQASVLQRLIADGSLQRLSSVVMTR